MVIRKYSGNGCDENELILHITARFNDTVKNTTKFSDGQNATELDFVSTVSSVKIGNYKHMRPGIKLY